MSIYTSLSNSAPARRVWMREGQVRRGFRSGTLIKQLEQVNTRRPVFAHACSDLKETQDSRRFHSLKSNLLSISYSDTNPVDFR